MYDDDIFQYVGSTELLPKSPDLIPLDYYVWNEPIQKIRTNISIYGVTTTKNLKYVAYTRIGIKVFLSFVHHPVLYKTPKNTTFRKLDLFPSSGQGVGPLELTSITVPPIIGIISAWSVRKS
jgi:hypothetical protein